MKKKILVYHIAGIGDTLVALPAFRMLKQNFPAMEMDLLNISVVPSTIQKELYEHDTIFANRTFLTSGSRFHYYLTFLRIVLNPAYSGLYCFSQSMPKLLNFLFSVFHGRKIFLCSPEQRGKNQRITEGYLEILEESGLKRGENLFDFLSTDKEREKASVTARKISGESAVPVIAFGIGGKEDVCHWPIEYYESLIALLKSKMQFIPVYIGGADDRKNAEYLIGKCGGSFLYDTDCRPLRNTIAFLRHCICYIGNDTGSLHLAATAGIPCAGVFSAHNLPPMKWHPFSKNSFIMRKEQPCSGCGLRICRFGSPAKCIASITPDEFYKKLTEWSILAPFITGKS